MSRQDKLDPSEIENGLPGSWAADDRLQIDLRLGLDEVAAAEEEQLRASPRRHPTKRELIHLASKLYDARRGRDRLFSDGLFGEPAWDMLLALYCLPSRGIALGITSLSYAANVPLSTGARWQKLLFEQGLIKRGPHVTDARQQLVGLSDKGRELMEKYLLRLFYCRGDVETLDG